MRWTAWRSASAGAGAMASKPTIRQVPSPDRFTPPASIMQGHAVGPLFGRGDLKHLQGRAQEKALIVGDRRRCPACKLGQRALADIEQAVEMRRAPADLQAAIHEEML